MGQPDSTSRVEHLRVQQQPSVRGSTCAWVQSLTQIIFNRELAIPGLSADQSTTGIPSEAQTHGNPKSNLKLLLSRIQISCRLS